MNMILPDGVIELGNPLELDILVSGKDSVTGDKEPWAGLSIEMRICLANDFTTDTPINAALNKTLLQGAAEGNYQRYYESLTGALVKTHLGAHVGEYVWMIWLGAGTTFRAARRMLVRQGGPL